MANELQGLEKAEKLCIDLEFLAKDAQENLDYYREEISLSEHPKKQGQTASTAGLLSGAENDLKLFRRNFKI